VLAVVFLVFLREAAFDLAAIGEFSFVVASKIDAIEFAVLRS